MSSEVARLVSQHIDGRDQGGGLLMRDTDIGEHLIVEGDGGIFDRRAPQVGDPHQGGAAVGRVRYSLDEAVALQSPDGVGDARDMHL